MNAARKDGDGRNAKTEIRLLLTGFPRKFHIILHQLKSPFASVRLRNEINRAGAAMQRDAKTVEFRELNDLRKCKLHGGEGGGVYMFGP